METPEPAKTGDGVESLLKNLRDFCRWKNNPKSQQCSHEAHSVSTIVPCTQWDDSRCGTKHHRLRPNPVAYQSTQAEPERQQQRYAVRRPGKPSTRGMRVQYPRMTQAFRDASNAPSPCEACPISPSAVSELSGAGSASTAMSAVGVCDENSRVAAAFLEEAPQLRPFEQGSPAQNLEEYLPPSAACATPHTCCSLSADEQEGPHSTGQRRNVHKTLVQQCTCRPPPAAALRSASRVGSHPPEKEAKKRYSAHNPCNLYEVWSLRGDESAFHTEHLESSSSQYNVRSPAVGVYWIRKPGGQRRDNCGSPVALPYANPRTCQRHERLSSKRHSPRVIIDRQNRSLVKDANNAENAAFSSTIKHKPRVVFSTRHEASSREPNQRIRADYDNNSYVKGGTFDTGVSQRTKAANLFPTVDSTAVSYEQTSVCARRKSALANTAVCGCSGHHVDEPFVRRPRSGKVVIVRKDLETLERDAQRSTLVTIAQEVAQKKENKASAYRRTHCSDVRNETARPSAVGTPERPGVTGPTSPAVCRDLHSIIEPATSHNRNALTRPRSFSSGKREGRSTSSHLRRRWKDLPLHFPDPGRPANRAIARSTEACGTKGTSTSDNHSVDASNSGALLQGLKLCPVCPVLAWVAATTATKCCYCGSVPSISSNKRILGEKDTRAADIVVVSVDNSSHEHQPADTPRFCSFLTKSAVRQEEDAERGACEVEDVQEERSACPEAKVETGRQPDGLKYCRQSAQQIREQLAHQQELLLKRAQKLHAQDPHLFADADLGFPVNSAEDLRMRGSEGRAAVSTDMLPEKRGFVAKRLVSSIYSTGQPSSQNRYGRRCSKEFGGAESDESTASENGTARTPCLYCHRVVSKNTSGLQLNCTYQSELKRSCQHGDTSTAVISDVCRTSTSTGVPNEIGIQTGGQKVHQKGQRGTHELTPQQKCAPSSVVATISCQEAYQKNTIATKKPIPANNALESTSRSTESNHQPLASGKSPSDALIDNAPAAAGVNKSSGSFPASKSSDARYNQPIDDVAKRESAGQLPPAHGQEAEDLVAAVLKHLVTVQQHATATAQGMSPSPSTVTTDANAVPSNPRAASIPAVAPSCRTSSLGDSHLWGTASGAVDACCTTDVANKQAQRTHQQILQLWKLTEQEVVSAACEYQGQRRKQVPGKKQGGGVTTAKRSTSSAMSGPPPSKGDASISSNEKRATKKKGLHAGTCIPTRGRVSDKQRTVCPLRGTPLTRSPSLIRGFSGFSTSCGTWRGGSASPVIGCCPAGVRSKNSPSTSLCTAPSTSRHDSTSRQSVSTNKECVLDRATFAGNQSENAIAAATAAAIAASVASAAAAVARKSAEKLAKCRNGAENTTSSSSLRSGSTCSPVTTASTNYQAGPPLAHAHSDLRKSVPQTGSVSGSQAREASPVAPDHERIPASSKSSAKEQQGLGCSRSGSIENGTEGISSGAGGSTTLVLSNIGTTVTGK